MNFNTVKTRIFVLIVVMLSGDIDAQSYKKTDSGLILSAGNLAIEVKWYGGNTVRVMKYPVGKSLVKNSLAVIQKEQQTRFSVSENEFDNYNYEKGYFTEIPFHWNEKSKTLTVEARKGKFNGMIEKRNFSLLLRAVSRKP